MEVFLLEKECNGWSNKLFPSLHPNSFKVRYLQLLSATLQLLRPALLLPQQGAQLKQSCCLNCLHPVVCHNL
jgi:hypothetical protein